MKNENATTHFGPISLHGFRTRTVAWFRGHEMHEMHGGRFNVDGVGEFASMWVARDFIAAFAANEIGLAA